MPSALQAHLDSSRRTLPRSLREAENREPEREWAMSLTRPEDLNAFVVVPG